jgi:hypothetical protein
VSQGVPVRDALPPAPREAITFRTDQITMRRVRDLARHLGVSTNDALNIIVKIQLAGEAVRPLTPEQVARVDAIVASLGAHTTGEDGT